MHVPTGDRERNAWREWVVRVSTFVEYSTDKVRNTLCEKPPAQNAPIFAIRFGMITIRRYYIQPTGVYP